jgi:hypothetical protein
MTHKSATQPLCLWCGKRIAKVTTSHRTPKTGFTFDKSEIVTLEELRRTTNEKIVSVKYHHEHESYEDLTPGEIYAKQLKRHVSGRRTVYSYTTWDGESYVDEFFCNGDHAQRFAYAAARHGLRLKGRNAA